MRQPRRARFPREILQLAHLRSGVSRDARRRETLDAAARFDGGLKDAESGFRRQFGDIGHFQPKAQIRLVGSVARYGVGVANAGKGFTQLFVRRHRFNHPGIKLLGKRQHILLVNETHFQIKLGELRLPVRPQILIPETAGYLKIPLHARHHQQLL